MGLKSLVKKCGEKDPPGVEVDMFVTCSCELNAFPALSTGGDDDDVRLSEAFDFTGADTGEGYWRKYTAVVDKNFFAMGMEGEVGNEDLFSTGGFYIKGTDSTRAQFAVDFVGASGCLLVAMKPRKGDDYVIIGTKQIPAFIESLDFNSGQKTGDNNGGLYAIRANTNIHYYDETLGINEIPAA